jgi:hypothetical protein
VRRCSAGRLQASDQPVCWWMSLLHPDALCRMAVGEHITALRSSARWSYRSPSGGLGGWPKRQPRSRRRVPGRDGPRSFRSWRRGSWPPAPAPSPGGCRCAEGGTPDPCPRDHPARPGVKVEPPQPPVGRPAVPVASVAARRTDLDAGRLSGRVQGPGRAEADLGPRTVTITGNCGRKF